MQNLVNDLIKAPKIKQKLLELCNMLTEENKKIIQNMFATLKLYNVDDDTYASAFLYVIYEKEEVDFNLISQHYNEQIKEILTNLYTVSFTTKKTNDEEIENVRNMLIVMAKDLRVLIILLCYVLYFAENNEIVELDHAGLFMHSVQDIYAPLSARLGLSKIKNRLESAGFKYLHPQMYEKLSNEEILNKDIREQQVKIAIEKIKDAMREIGIVCEVMGRQKQLSSIFNKMKNKNLTLKQLFDLMAVRIIVATVEECYIVLGKINSAFKIVPNRFKDYIANPKPNGYQSIHTCILSENERPIELQIRTKEMHQFAEYGVAAHWLYKEHKKGSLFNSKINWLRKVVEESESLSSKEFLENVKIDMFVDEIYAQTPNGKILKFPLGASCIDFAYAIHSDIGNKCIGAKINGKIVPLYRELQNGDECEIVVSKLAKGPSRDWLKIVKTREARSKINAYFKKELIAENIKKGRSIFNAVCKDKGKQPADILASANLASVLNRYSLNGTEEMFAAIGIGSISCDQILNKLEMLSKDNKIVFAPDYAKKSSSLILVDAQQDVLTRFAKCCTPIPGDEIVGFISQGRGVTIHRADCVNVKSLDNYRFISVAWGGNEKASVFTAKIKANFASDVNLIKNIIQFMDENKIKIVSLNTKTVASDISEIDIGINVNSNKQLDYIMQKMHNLPNFVKVYRSN